MNRASARTARATIAVLALLAGPVATAAAAAGPVVNASFERSSASTREFTSQNDELPAEGWAFWDPQRLIAPVGDPAGGMASLLGIWVPSAHAYPAGLPDGEAVGFLYAADGIGTGELGLRQVTSARLTAGRRYLLRVAVGNPGADDARAFPVAGFPGYRIELRAGGRLLAHEQDRVKPAEGAFAATELAYRATTRDRSLGRPIEIRLVNRNARAGAEVDFDDVELQSVSPSGARGTGGVAGVVKSGGGGGAGAASGGAWAGGATRGGAAAPAE